MKRQKGSRRARKSGQSPYAKYAKAPYLYSQAYYDWRYKITGKTSDRRAQA